MSPVITETTFKPQIPPDAHKILFAAQIAAAQRLQEQGKQMKEK
jgi:hypothetical protein